MKTKYRPKAPPKDRPIYVCTQLTGWNVRERWIRAENLDDYFDRIYPRFNKFRKWAILGIAWEGRGGYISTNGLRPFNGKLGPVA